MFVLFGIDDLKRSRGGAKSELKLSAREWEREKAEKNTYSAKNSHADFKCETRLDYNNIDDDGGGGGVEQYIVCVLFFGVR